MKTKTIVAMFGLVASTFAIIIKIITPATIQFVIQGNVIELNKVPNIYHAYDVAVIGGSTFVMGVSLIYLLMAGGGDDSHQAEASEGRGDFRGTFNRLTNADERSIVQLIVDEGGTIFQSELVERSGFSKSKVSLVLDRLEARRVLERRRRGMSNVVVLK